MAIAQLKQSRRYVQLVGRLKKMTELNKTSDLTHAMINSPMMLSRGSPNLGWGRYGGQ